MKPIFRNALPLQDVSATAVKKFYWAVFKISKKSVQIIFRIGIFIVILQY